MEVYLFEFFMLFLAVSAGFFMENIRETYVERERAEGLVGSLVTDLKKDTALLNWLTDFRESRRRLYLDSFYALLDEPAKQADQRSYYDLAFKIRDWYPFRQSAATITQLENAGYLRYFSDEKLLDYLSQYDFRIQDFKNDESIDFHLQYDKLMELIRTTLDHDITHALFLENRLPSGIGIPTIKPELLQQIKSVIIEVMWYNKHQMIMQNERIKKNATDIIEYLQDRYHLSKL